jgi:hypothetical protein
VSRGAYNSDIKYKSEEYMTKKNEKREAPEPGVVGQLKAAEERIDLPIPGIRVAGIELTGKTDLIVNHFNEKSRQEMLDKQMGVTRGARKAKNPQEVFELASYKIVGMDGWHGFPCNGFKQMAVRGAKYVSGITMQDAKSVFFVFPPAEYPDARGEIGTSEGFLTPILDATSDEDRPCVPRMIEDVVRNASGVADIRFRPLYSNWKVRLRVEYIENICSLQTILACFSYGGIVAGVGERRPEKEGNNFGQNTVTGASRLTLVGG